MIGLLAIVAQLQVVATAPDSVGRCEPVDVTVTVAMANGVVPEVRPLALGPFDVLRASPSPEITTDLRTRRTVAAFHYVLTTGSTGEFTVGPFEATVNEQAGRSAPLRVAVHPVPEGLQVPHVVARARIDTGFSLALRTLAHPETVYVGQQANYEVAVFLNQTVRERMRRNPTFFPPDMRSMLAYDLPLDAARHTSAGARCYDALVYQRALFPLFPGRLSIPPAQLVYSLPLSISYWSQEESHELATDSTIVVAIEPPAAGRPADYAGAVGRLSARVHVDSAHARVGDPLVLTLRVSGTGNVKLFPRPVVRLPWAIVVNADERVTVDTTARRVRGSKEFDWLITPRIAGELDLPPIRYPYFDPDARRYEVATTDALNLHVGPGALAQSDTLLERMLAIRTAYGPPVGPPPTGRPWYWAALAIIPLPALGRRWRARRRPRRRIRSAAEVLRGAVRDPRATADACALRRAYVAAFADRLGVEPQRFTRPGALAHALRRAGVSPNVARDAERFLRVLDEGAYSRDGALPPRAAANAVAHYDAADAEALPRAELHIPSGAIVLLVAAATGVLAATAIATPPTPAHDSFARGVVEYQQRLFTPARHDFAASVRAEPRSPDAWANLGTAAWATSDTALAVLAWQRALHLEPSAADARAGLELIRPLRFGGAGYVPPLPREALPYAALALWIVGWIALALPRRYRPADLRHVATGAIVVAAGLLLLSLDLADRMEARRVGVVRAHDTLVRAPALGADPAGNVETGEVALMSGREGAWTHVAFDDGREGWLPSDAMAPVASLPPGD